MINGHILHLIDSGNVYGAERLVLDMLPELKRLGYKVSLACLRSESAARSIIQEELEKEGIPVFFIHFPGKFSFLGIREILGVMRTIGASALHVHGYKSTIVGGIIGLSKRLPTIATYHSIAPKYNVKLSFYLCLESLVLRKISLVVGVSSDICQELRTRGVSSNRLFKVLNGIAGPVSNTRNRSFSMYRQKSAFHVFAVGRLIKIKNFEMIIDVFARLKSDYQNIHLSIAGDGPLLGSLKARVHSLGLNRSVQFLGYVRNIQSVYESADCFVLASKSEGVPISILEAMASSSPIIATEVGGIREVICHGKTGLLVPPNNPIAFYDSLKALLDDNEMRISLGEAARRSFEERFTSKKMAKSYSTLYDRIDEILHT